MRTPLQSLLVKVACAPLVVIGAGYGIALVAFLALAFVIEEEDA